MKIKLMAGLAVVTILLMSSLCSAINFAPFEACKTAGTDLYVKKFKNTKKNAVKFTRGADGCEIEIISDKSGSMLVRTVDLESDKYKYISFDIKISNVIDKAELRKKDGDDAPARVYVFFEYEPGKAGILEKAYRGYSKNKRDGNAIVYVWGSSEKTGDVIENPYSENFIEIVVESGAGSVGRYKSFRRNVYDDYKKHFKSDPPGKITSIAIMTDTDNTGSSATGYFKGIFLTSDP